MVLHDEIHVGDLSKFGIKYLTIECQPDKELEEMKAEWRHPNSVSQIISFLICWVDVGLRNMFESFQDYSWIQDFEGDFPKKVSLKMLNSIDYSSFFVRSISVCLIRQLTI